MGIKIYGRENCVHCTRAKQFLDNRGWPYEYIDMTDWDNNQIIRLAMEYRMRTVPIVVVDGVCIGGADYLEEYIKAVENRSV